MKAILGQTDNQVINNIWYMLYVTRLLNTCQHVFTLSPLSSHISGVSFVVHYVDSDIQPGTFAVLFTTCSSYTKYIEHIL